jgi:transmembrane sensor
MKNKNTDPFKDALRKKMTEKPVRLETDAQLWRRVLNEVKPDPKTIYKTEYPWYAMAAAVLLFICFGIGLFLYNSKGNILSQNLEKEEAPISNNHVLSQNFKVEKEKALTDLSESSDKKSSSNTETLKKETFAEQKTITTASNLPALKYFNNAKVIRANNKIREHNLIDGSLVALNEGSTIKIDNAFKNQRNIMLEGEAYFNVAPDKNKPFTVYFSDYKLIVIGTKFNIRNIGSEKIKEITVTEGVVRVFDNNNEEGIKVKKGEQLKLSPGIESVVKKVEADNYISWKTGNMDFKRTRLEEVAVLLSRQFDQKIILANQIKNCKFTGDLSGLNLDESLKILSSSTSLKVEKSNRKIYITGSGCD